MKKNDWNKTVYKWLAIFMVLVFVLQSCRSAPREIQKIRLPMGYFSNVQYAPFYVAIEKGYFKDAGLEIEFDYSLETNGVALVGANKLPFAVVSGEQVLLARNQGLPVTYIFAWWQDYPVGIASLKDAQILKPEDLKGKKIGIPGLFGASYVGLRALLNAGGLTEADVQLDSIGFNQVEALTAGQEDAVVIYTNNEPVQLKARGYEINELAVKDYVRLASNGLITNETVLSQKPMLIKRMIEPLSKGIRDVISDPAEAFEICQRYVDGLASLPEDELAIQREVLNRSIEFWKTENIGVSQPEAWENMRDVLLEMDMIQAGIDLSKSYTNEFVK
jgi:NitT/TauT family transport system substrate-binding protein